MPDATHVGERISQVKKQKKTPQHSLILQAGFTSAQKGRS